MRQLKQINLDLPITKTTCPFGQNRGLDNSIRLTHLVGRKSHQEIKFKNGCIVINKMFAGPPQTYFEIKLAFKN